MNGRLKDVQINGRAYEKSAVSFQYCLHLKKRLIII